jgi:uncharacterized protein (TIRG00374 family)
MPERSRLSLPIGPLVWSIASAVIVVPFALWRVSLGDAWRLLQQADWRPVLFAAGIYVLTVLAKTARWQLLFEPAMLPFGSLCAALSIGVAVNFLLPARLGEVARVYVLRRREGEYVARLAGTVVAEKLVDLAALGLVTLIAVPFAPLPPWLRTSALRLTAILLVGGLLVATVSVHMPRVRALWRWIARTFVPVDPNRLEKQFDLAVAGFAPLRRPAVLLRVGAWSAAIWCLMIATNYVLFFALPLQPSWVEATVMLLVLNLGVAVPSTPGKFGVFPALANVTLGLFGVSREAAFSYGALLYLVVIVPQLGLAGIFAWQELSGLRLAARSVGSAS